MLYVRFEAGNRLFEVDLPRGEAVLKRKFAEEGLEVDVPFLVEFRRFL